MSPDALEIGIAYLQGNTARNTASVFLNALFSTAGRRSGQELHIILVVKQISLTSPSYGGMQMESKN